MVWSEDPLPIGDQGGEQIPGTGPIPGATGPVGEDLTGGERVAMIWSEDPLPIGEQGGEQIPGTSPITGLPGHDGEAVTGLDWLAAWLSVDNLTLLIAHSRSHGVAHRLMSVSRP